VGKEVIAVDRNKERVQKAQEFCSYALVGDATDKSMLDSIGVEKGDTVMVSLGDNISASVLVTLYLKDLDVQNVQVKIISEDHGRVLDGGHLPGKGFGKEGGTDPFIPQRH
jgi:trk system potassium uptake protein TrkA